MTPLSVVLGPSSSPQAGTVQVPTMHIVCRHSRLLQLPVPVGPLPPVPPPDVIGGPPPVPDADPPWPPVSAGFGLTPAQAAPTANDKTSVTRGKRFDRK